MTTGYPEGRIATDSETSAPFKIEGSATREMETARELTNEEVARLEYDAEKVELLLDYITILDEAGLDAGQMYSRHARACNKIEKLLGVDDE